MSKNRIFSFIWLAVIGLFIANTLYLFIGNRLIPDSNIMALLPVEKRDPFLQKAFDQIVQTSEQRVIILIGAEKWEKATKAASAYKNVIAKHSNHIQLTFNSIDDMQSQLLPFFQQYQYHFLTNTQRHSLQTNSLDYWVNFAKEKLYAPFGTPQLITWQKDPFSIFNDWALERLQESPVRSRDNYLYVTNGKFYYVLLPLVVQQPVFSISTQRTILPILEEAKEKAIHEQAKVLSAGVLFHASSASKNATSEISTIGLGSLIGIIILIVVTFRSLRSIFLVGISLLSGVMGAIAICYLVYEKIHILTLVFGASIIGLAQDYGIYYLCNRIYSQEDSFNLTKKLLPGLFLTLLTTVVAYLGLLFTPFPGLNQMALFAITGLIFAWMTVICIFPLFSKTSSQKLGLTFYSQSIHHWPQITKNKRTLFLGVAIAIFCAIGISNLSINDDIRVLQKMDEQLVKEQIEINQLLDIPAIAQFYLIKGKNEEDLLQKEEALTQKLEQLVKDKKIRGYQATSNWIPSIQKQKENQALLNRTLLSEQGPYFKLKKEFGLTDFVMQDDFLTLKQFFKTIPNNQIAFLWLGKLGNEYGSIITLRGLNPDQIPSVSQFNDEVNGILWVDKISSISSTLGFYRHFMSWFILFAYGVILILLSIRYKKEVWRVLSPPFLASIITLAIMGFLGKELNLFHVLAFMLILGVGVDSGIFFQESINKEAVWLEIGLAATSTILAFGLLSLSSTPALHSFGLTLLIGIFLVWILVPCFQNSIRKDTSLKDL